MEYHHKSWGKAELITVHDPATKFTVEITNFGASLVRIRMPDRTGQVSDIIFGQNSPEDYETIGGYLGASVGRVANRIAQGKFTLNGIDYNLPKNNNGIHCLHGGKQGFSHKLWKLLEISAKMDPNEVSITMEYVSPDEEEGFPGTLTARITYLISPMFIAWEFSAFSDQPTLVNLTNHAYWNLKSLDSTIDDHVLTLKSRKYSAVDATCLPTGEICDVAENGLDFNGGKTLKAALQDFGDIDNNFFIDGFDQKPAPDDLLEFAELFCPTSGRYMKLATTEPCVQLYTGNFMAKLSSFGTPCQKHGAVCLETQKVPNAINVPEFEQSVLLNPGEIYFHRTEHHFGIII